MAFNVLREGPWNDSRVRRAISLWIDKQAAIPAVLGGFGWTSPDLGPPDIPIQRHFINWPKFNRVDFLGQQFFRVKLGTG